MYKRSLGVLLVLAVALHALLLGSVFDIYFRSPLGGGAFGDVGTANLPLPSPPAKRLVLFVADGLRAISFFETPSRAPHLHHIMQNFGAWGVSNTRIPTESRPGHVAIIAGFYEDPSAIARGWKENPVNFDSVFNQSRYTWSWGSPDILPMFAKGATGNRVYTDFYTPEEEDFSGKVSTIRLDEWVFNKVEAFFTSANNNKDLANKLKQNKIIFFLHLLGLDTAGHTHKPNSREYKQNIRAVDKGVAKIVKIIENFYGDHNTAYILTADHGMTDWGSHGDGSDNETKTPIVAWGAGIAKSNYPESIYQDAVKKFKYPASIEISQADICPLMATLIGLEIPIDSVGMMPENYLNVTVKDKAGFMYQNMRQILTQYDGKRKLIEKEVIKFIYKPFEELTGDKISKIMNRMEILMLDGHFNEVIKYCKFIIKLSLEGLDYYQNYYQQVLLICITMTFVGWIFWLLTILLEDMAKIERKYLPARAYGHRFVPYILDSIFGIFSLTCTLLIFLQDLPLQYYVYFNLPIFLWWRVSLSWKLWHNYFVNLDYVFQSSYFISYMKLFTFVSVFIFGTVILTCAFFHRWVLCVGLFGLAIFPAHKSYSQYVPSNVGGPWVMFSIVLGMFTFTPVVGKQNDTHFVAASGVIWFIIILVFAYKYTLPMLEFERETKKESVIIIIPAIMMLLAAQNKYMVEHQFNVKNGISFLVRLLAWELGAMSFIIPFLSSKWMVSRLFSIHTSFAVLFILLSVTHEGMFLLNLVFELSLWLCIEHNTENREDTIMLAEWVFEPRTQKDSINKMRIDRVLTFEDFRRSFIFLFFIILSFFGTGNVASVNSFDPQWVRSFVTEFSPFTMTGLILTKTLIPFLSVSCTFCAINAVVNAPTAHLFVIVLIFSDMMGLYFLHMVTNKGSWLEIGTSLSHYVIMESTVFFFSILYGLGQFLTQTSLWSLLRMSDRLKNI